MGEGKPWLKVTQFADGWNAGQRARTETRVCFSLGPQDILVWQSIRRAVPAPRAAGRGWLLRGGVGCNDCWKTAWDLASDEHFKNKNKHPEKEARPPARRIPRFPALLCHRGKVPPHQPIELQSTTHDCFQRACKVFPHKCICASE